jgi:hypothetical protein
VIVPCLAAYTAARMAAQNGDLTVLTTGSYTD